MNMNDLTTVGEAIEAKGGKRDILARRRLNTNPDTVADITAKEIEGGQVTIETLENLNTEVFLYATQATIHGKLPDIKNRTDALGYKSIIINGNGTVGIRYSAIDAGKKKQIANAISVWRDEKKANYFHNSTDFAVYRCYGQFTQETISQYKQAIEEAKKDLEAMPKCFYGSASIRQTNVWGLISVFVIAYIGAIYTEEIDKLVEWFTGHTTDETLAKLEEKRIKREQERQEWTARYEESKRIDEEKKRIALDQLNKELADNPPTGYQGEGSYLYKVCVRGNDGEYRIKEGEITYKKTPKGYTIQYGTEKAKFYDKETFDRIIASPAKKLWKKGIEKKVIESKGVQSEGIAVSHNTEKNGVEIKFKSKPSQSVIDSLKANGFRFTYNNGGLWYNKYSQKALDFANSIVA